VLFITASQNLAGFLLLFSTCMHTIQKVNTNLRQKLQPLFAELLPVDLGIKSILEGQSGKQIRVVVDDRANPGIALIRYGTFGVLGGNALHPDAVQLIQSIVLPCAVQPSPEPWMNLLQNKYGEKLKWIERFSFTHEHINIDHLTSIITQHPYGQVLHDIDTATAHAMEKEEWHKYHLFNYESPDDFAANSFASGITLNGELASVCSAALHCTTGIELNIITLPAFRNKGLAAVVAACTIKKAIANNLIPHWDAANERSSRLAMRLGYKQTGSYRTCYILE
jgi:hypothetical protein